MQGKKKTEKKAAGKSKVNIAMTKQDSIFPNLNLPGGISTKATEYKELGMRGEKWESPVFKLGSAPRSTNVARAPQVSRKRHPATQGGLRGPGGAEDGTPSRAAGTGGQSTSTTGAGPATYNQTGPSVTGPTTMAVPSTTTVPSTTAIPSATTAPTTTGTRLGHTLLGERNPVFTGDV